MADAALVVAAVLAFTGLGLMFAGMVMLLRTMYDMYREVGESDKV